MRQIAIVVACMCLAGCRSAAPERPKPTRESAPAPPTPRRATPTPAVLRPPIGGIAPLPTALALAGNEGRDSYGYPTQYVDKAGLRSLLLHKRYADLTRNLETFQARFEADNSYEYWPTDAADAFGSSEPQLLPFLNEWVIASPDSFAPYLARGTYWQNVARTSRGVKWAPDTSEEELAGMRDAHGLSRKDLARSLQLRPKLMAAQWVQMATLYGEAEDARRRTLDAALASCPRCYLIRAAYMSTLVPRWGGSYEAMAAFARESEQVPNPKMRLLKGYVDQDQANMLHISRRYAEALVAIERACALGDHPRFLKQRGQAYRRLNQLDKAMQDFDRALELHPPDSDMILQRAKIHSLAQRWEPAARDLVAGLRIDPSSEFGLTTRGIVLPPLLNEATQAQQAGRRGDAVRLIELAAQLAPENADVQARRAALGK